MVKMNGPMECFDLKNICLDIQIIILSALVKTLWSKRILVYLKWLPMLHVCEHLTAYDNSNLLTDPYPRYFVLTCASSIRDMVQTVVLER